MAVTIGELVAKLRADTTQFDAAMGKAEKSIITVDGGLKRMAAGTNVYAKAVRERLGLERELIDTLHAEALLMNRSTTEIQRMGRAHSAASAVEAQRTRAMGLMHAEALRMNAAFSAGNTAAVRSVPSFRRLGEVVTMVAIQATGVNPALGRLGVVLGSFAIGSIVMTSVLAGLAAVAFAWKKIGEDAREAKGKLQEALEALEALARAKRIEPMGGELGVAVRLAGQELRALQQRIKDAEAMPFGQAGRDLPDMRDREKELIGLIAIGEAQIAKEAEQAAIKLEQEAAALDRLNMRLEEFKRNLARMPRDPFSIEARLAADTGPGRLLQGQSMGFGTAAARGVGVDRSADAVKEWVRHVKATADGMKNLSFRLEKPPGLLKQFSAGLQNTVANFIDVGALGANLAATGISSLLGTFIGGIKNVFFGERQQRQVSALERNTEALRRLAGKLRGDLGGRLDLAERRAEAADLTPAQRFAAMKAAFPVVPLSAPIAKQLGTIDPKLAAQIAAQTPEMIGAFLTGILDQIAAQTFDLSQLRGFDLTEFLDWIGSMESLGDAAADAAEEIGSLASTVRNAPAGYRVAFARFMAETPTTIATGGGGVGTGGGSPPGGIQLPPPTDQGDINVAGDIVIVTNDPDVFGEALRRQARRGGTTALQLATRPGGRFVTAGAV